MPAFTLPVATPLPRNTAALEILDRFRREIPSSIFYALGLVPTDKVEVNDVAATVFLPSLRLVRDGNIRKGDVQVTVYEEGVFDVVIRGETDRVALVHQGMNGDEMRELFGALSGH